MGKAIDTKLTSKIEKALLDGGHIHFTEYGNLMLHETGDNGKSYRISQGQFDFLMRLGLLVPVSDEITICHIDNYEEWCPKAKAYIKAGEKRWQECYGCKV